MGKTPASKFWKYGAGIDAQFIEQLPSDWQLPKQCWIVVSEVIFGNNLSFQLLGSPQLKPDKSSLAPQSLPLLGLFKKI